MENVESKASKDDAKRVFRFCVASITLVSAAVSCSALIFNYNRHDVRRSLFLQQQSASQLASSESLLSMYEAELNVIQKAASKLSNEHHRAIVEKIISVNDKAEAPIDCSNKLVFNHLEETLVAMAKKTAKENSTLVYKFNVLHANAHAAKLNWISDQDQLEHEDIALYKHKNALRYAMARYYSLSIFFRVACRLD
jgi:uncharacterized protein YejL (UPF0352 family)